MSPDTVRFLGFSLFGFASLATGYMVRRRGWLDEEASRSIHFHTVVWVWSAVLLLSLWRIPPQIENLWLLVVQPIILVVGAYGVIPLAKLMGWTRHQTGVMAIAAGLSNNGFTLGAYLCYSLLHPSDEALAYAMAYVSVTNVSVVLLIYPLAHHYGEFATKHGSLARLIFRSYFDVRALPMYGALAGVLLAVVGVPFPAFWERWRLLDTLFYIGAFGGYLGIGLRLRLGDSTRYLKHHILLFVVKFVGIPAIAMVLLMAINFTPRPLGELAQQVVLIQASMPCAIIVVMLANLFHLDVRMAGVIWMWNTAMFVVVPLPMILWLLH